MKPASPPGWRVPVFAGLIIILCVILIDRVYLAPELVYAQVQNRALQQDLRVTLKQLNTERTRATIAEREVDVVRQANALLRESERQHQDEMARLQTDLAFYRRLGGANGSQAALAIHHVELAATSAPRVFRINITLTQNLRWASAISGRVHLDIEGIHAGIAQHLDETQLLPETAQPLKFQFKYFQQLESLITLPADFQAARLSIRLESGGLRTSVSQSLSWRYLFSPPLALDPDTDIETTSVSGD